MGDSSNEAYAEPFGAAALERATDPRAARKKAMDLLARREYGHDELIGRLAAAGFQRDTATEAVDVLAGEGLQDDRRFAENFVAARAGRGGGPLRIRHALIERGLKSALVDRVLDAFDADWFEQAREVRLKKYGAAPPADYREKARQMRFLQYRGFDHEQIRYAMEEM